MFCTNCGAQVPDGMEFCTNCGTRLRAGGADDAAGAVGANGTAGAADTADTTPATTPLTDGSGSAAAASAAFCTNCGAQMPDGMEFCTNCGTRVGAAGGAGQADDPWPFSSSSSASEGFSPDVTQAYPAGTYDYAYADAAATEPPKKRSRGLVAAAAVLGVLAVAAVVALVVVVVDPFGLNLLDNAPTEVEEQVVETDTDPAESETTPDAEEETTEEETSEEESTEEETTEEEEETTSETESGSGSGSSSSGSGSSSSGSGSSGTGGSSSSSKTTTSSGGTYILADSASHLYTTSELSDLSNWELYIARNEIYARHGRMFQKEDLQNYFNAQSWYTPLYSPSDFDSSLLNSTEQQNAATILALEKSRGSEYI